MIYLELFLAFIQIGLFSIGGGYAAIPLIQAKAVDDYAWISSSEFADLITIAEMTPGPIAVNSATFVGIRVGGITGALVATLACILPSIIIVSLFYYLYSKYKGLSVLDSVMNALRACVVSLILSAGISLLKTALLTETGLNFLGIDPIQACLFIVAFLLLRIKKWNPILTMALTGIVGALLHIVI